MVATSAYLIVFRVLHVMAAIAWGGSVFLFVLYVQPSARAVGPAAGPFMRELLGNRKLVHAILGLAAVTIVAGGFLYWHDWQQAGSLDGFLGTAFGLWLTIGSISALVAFSIGLFGTRPKVGRVLELAGQVARAGDAPPAEIVGELQATQATLRTLARLNLLFVAVAAFAMATARYW